MAPTVKFLGADMQLRTILEFVDFHHNIMVFANNEVRGEIKKLANEFGVDFEDYGFTMQGGKAPKSAAQAGFSSDNVAWSNNVFAPLTGSKKVFSQLSRPVLFEDGIGAVIDTKNNE